MQQEVIAGSKAVACARSVYSEGSGSWVEPSTEATANLITKIEEGAIKRASPGHDEISEYVQQVAEFSAQVAELEEKGGGQWRNWAGSKGV